VNRNGFYAVRNVLIAVVVLLGIATTIIGVYLTPDDLATCETVSGSSPKCIKADAIVAISGGNTSVRAAEAIKLYQDGWADKLIFSGAAADMTGPSNAAVMRDQAIAAGVPADAIETEENAQTTRQNAERTKELLVSNNVQRVILVTSAYHQRRASLEFQSLVGEGIVVINRPASDDSDWPVLWWLTPRGWWLAGGELAKITAFYLGQSQ
jgi:uncharacterized SAM-binding protein YcdF (DUF218 family)